MASELALAMAGAASAHQAATAYREQNSQQRAGRTRRTSADPQRAQQGATAAALDSLSRLQQLADASPQVAQLRRLQALAAGRSAPVAQLAGIPEEEELVQGKFATAQPQPQLQQAPRANNTGLPDQLKSGIESLSGLSMDDVRVHYNSSQPAQLNALAYAQGRDIHLAPGQERHLPHEAWHVVQQAQGRVRPIMQMKEGVPVNDDVELEREADVMGARALVPAVQLLAGLEEEVLLHGRFERSQWSQSDSNAFGHDTSLPSDRKAGIKPISGPSLAWATSASPRRRMFRSSLTERTSVAQLNGHNSVPKEKLLSAINLTSWTKGSDERTMTVWQIAEDENWDFHFTAMYDPTGINMTKFHFTIRNKVGGGKGDDAFAWFEVKGHNKLATLGPRENAGKVEYWNKGTIENDRVSKKIRDCFPKIDSLAPKLLSKIVEFIK